MNTNNTMRVIAKAGDYEVIRDLNGLVEIRKGNGVWFCDKRSAYEAIREVPDKAIRAELLKQWESDGSRVKRAEEATPVVEAALDKTAPVKDLADGLKEAI